MSCARTAELIDLPLGLCTGVGQRKHKFNYIRQVAPMCRHAHWRNLANTIETSICCGDAALCQITLPTCYFYGYVALFIIAVLNEYIYAIRYFTGISTSHQPVEVWNLETSYYGTPLYSSHVLVTDDAIDVSCQCENTICMFNVNL